MKAGRLLTIAAVLAFTICARPAQAAQKSITYKGLTLTSAIENVELAPGQEQVSFKIKVENKQTVPASLSVSSLDFKSLNETGGVAFIGSNAASLEHKYGLANWITLPAGPVVLPPNSSRQVEITIDNRDDLSPGGHYAAILFRNTAPSGKGANRVDVNQVVSTLIFLKKSGGEQYGLTLQHFKPATAWFGLPTSLPLSLKNTGNTQTVPRGIANIEDSRGHIYARGQINIDSGLVLPESTRFYRTPLPATGHAWWPGFYKLSITYRPADIPQATTVEYRFFYVNLLSVFLLAGLLLIAAAAVRNYRSWS